MRFGPKPAGLMSQEVVKVFRRGKARRAKPEAACRAAAAVPVGVAIMVPDKVEVQTSNLSKEMQPEHAARPGEPGDH
jgi:hypothetical protein